MEKLTTPMSSCSVVREGAASVWAKKHSMCANSSISGGIFLIHLRRTGGFMMPYDSLVLQGSDADPDSRIHGINHTQALENVPE